MKLRNYCINLICFGSLFPLITIATKPAHAGCAVVAPTNQVAITGTQGGASQENTVTTASDDNCLGNTVVAPTNQVGIGSGEVQQSSEGDYFVGGGDVNQTGVSGPVIDVAPTNQIDVYSPAHDSDFINNKVNNVPNQ